MRVAKTPTLVAQEQSVYSFFVKNLDEAGQSAYSLEFSNAARTAMIAELWVVFAVVWSIMVGGWWLVVFRRVVLNVEVTV